MAARPEPQSPGAAARPATSSAGRRPAKLSRASVVNAALTFLDREGWDALTINALATQLGTKGPSLYNHVDSLQDLRRTVRMRVVGDIIEMLNTVGQGRTRDDAVMAMASAYRSYAHHHPGRYSAFTRMPLGGGDDPEFTDATRAAAGPVIAVLASYGLDGEDAFYAALEFWSAMHGFVLLEMTGVMGGIVDTDTVFSDMVMRLAAGMQRR
jgi:AcrR family transcriptional regulator